MPVLDESGGGVGQIVTAIVVVLAPPILSQIDSISGGAGWAGAGLLGLVLAWLLLVHLPAQDKKMDAMVKAKDLAIEVKDKQIEKVMDEFRQEAKDQRDAHKEVLDKVCAEFREQIKLERSEYRKGGP